MGPRIQSSLSRVQEDLNDPGDSDRPWTCHRRFWWDFLALDCCPIHRTWLIDACPKCKAIFDTDYTDIRICRCRYDLASYTCDVVNESDCEIDQYILARLLGTPASGLGPLDNMPLDSAIAAIAGLGSIEVLGESEQFKSVNRERRLESKIAAGALLQNWPLAFCKNLDQRAANHEPEVTDSAGRIYGSLYRWLTQHADPAFDILRSTFEQHYLSTRTLYRQTRIFGRRACSLTWTSLSTLNTECGLPSDSRILLPFLRALGMATSGRRRGILRIPRSRVAELVSLRENSLPVGEAAKRLGTTRQQIGAFVRSGLIRSLYRGNSVHFVSKSDVTRLLDATVGVQTRTFDDIPRGATRLALASKAFKGASLSQILQAILEGSVSIIGRLSFKSGLDALLVDSVAVVRLFSPQGKSGRTISLRDAARLLHVTLEALDGLIRLGYLGTLARQEIPRQLHLASVRAFKCEYMSAGHVSPLVGMTAFSLSSALRKHGIVGHRVGRGRFFRRTKKLYAWIEKLRQLPFKSRMEAVLSVARQILLEHGRPLRGRDIAAAFAERGLPIPGRVRRYLSIPQSGFFKVPGRRYWIVGKPLPST